MSTILDSLKKSSDNRDGHEQTSIDSFNFSQSKKSSKSGIIMVIILLLITAVTLYYGYNYINSEPKSAKHSTELMNATVTEKQNAEVVALVTEQNNTEQVKVEKNSQSEKIKGQSKKIKKPDNAVVKKQLSERITNLQKQEANKQLAQEIKMKNDANKVTSQTKNKSINPVTRKDKIKNRANNTDAEKPMIKLSMPDEKNNARKDKRNTKSKPPVIKKEYTYVYQLPFAVRKEIPKFKLNVHIYDESPENRVAVINGSRFEVNDLIEEQVLVKDIVQEGVLLEFNGNVFLVPIL